MKSCCYLIVICLLFDVNVNAQSSFNFDMELIDPSTKQPKGWKAVGDKNSFIQLDSLNKQDGRYSLLIENKTTGSSLYSDVSYSIKAIYAGTKARLKAFIKTENLQGGYAGLFIHIRSDRTDKVSKKILFSMVQIW